MNTSRYTDADQYITEQVGSGAKTMRGFGEFYNALVNSFTSDPSVFLEIGIGFLHSHLVWSQVFTQAKIVGLDIASPVLDLCIKQECHTRQYENAINGMRMYATVPMHFTKNLHLLYNKNAYDIDTVHELLDLYGKFDLVINDGLQTNYSHLLFRNAYTDILSETGILVQEKIGRSGSSNASPHQMKKAISHGWLIYDVRNDVKFEDPESVGYIGVWSHNQDHYRKIFKDFKLVEDPYKCIPLDRQED
jgi:hypothetical protein